MREQAINRLDASEIDPIRRLFVANRYDIPEWAPKATSELVNRKERLTDEEAERLGWKDAFTISRLREDRSAQLMVHFTDGHTRSRHCTAGHRQWVKPPPKYCERSQCGQRIEEEIGDGCEIVIVRTGDAGEEPEEEYDPFGF